MSAAQLSEAVTGPSLFTSIHYNNKKVAKSSTVYILKDVLEFFSLRLLCSWDVHGKTLYVF